MWESESVSLVRPGDDGYKRMEKSANSLLSLKLIELSSLTLAVTHPKALCSGSALIPLKS